MKRKKLRFGIFYGGAIIAIVILCLSLFWQKIGYQHTATGQVTRILKAQGLNIASIKVDSLGANDAIISDIKLSESNPLTIKNLQLQYSALDLIAKNFQGIKADGVDATIYKKDGKWQIGGLEPLMSKDSGDGTNIGLPFDLPTLQDNVPALISINNANIKMKDEGLSLEAPFDLFFTSANGATLNITSDGVRFASGAAKIQTGNINIDGKLNNEMHKWQGNIAAYNITSEGLPRNIEPLKLNSYISISPEKFFATFAIFDKSKITNADIYITFSPQNPADGMINIKHLSLPWGGGKIAVHAINIPLQFDKPIPIALQLHEVDVDKLLGSLSGGEIKGSGKISGTLPLTYYPDGHITLQKGEAAALTTGIISVPPSMLPSDNPQVMIAKSALENFHYTSLKIGVYSEDGEKSVINLALQGNNPDALEGRQINLNVNVTGDLIPLLQQSVLPFNDLKQLLKIKSTP
jgi:hypothetical protein